jgi:hypothetical protein
VGDLDALPGGDLVERGLADLAAGRTTPEALLVSTASSALRLHGLPVDGGHAGAELALYDALCRQDPATAYPRYKALLGRLDSFLAALDAERGRALRAASHADP